MHKRKRKMMNVEHDRLSSLPDDLIHKILSFIDIKGVVQTSVLSSRWRFVWTSTPYLNFSIGLSSSLEFSNIVEHVLSGRNNEIDVYSVKLYIHGKFNQMFVGRIINYAFSHNVQKMSVTSCEISIVFPLSLLKCQSLKHLSLGGDQRYLNLLTITSTFELPSLTTLHLYRVRLNDNNNDSFFAKCVNLKSLTLNCCQMMGSGGFTICHPQLLSFTLIFGVLGVIKVVAPQLKYVSLDLFTYDEANSLPFFLNGFPLLEEVDICILYPKDAPKIINMLQEFCVVKYLKINLEIVEFLSSKVDLISNQPCPFSNLKTLKIYPKKDNLESVDVSAVVESYFLDSSPTATFAMVSREEVRAVKNAKLAQECFPKVQLMLDELKTDLDKGKTIIEIDNEKMHDDDDVKGEAKVEDEKGSMKQIQSCWKDLSLRVTREQEMVSRIFSQLKYIEELLTHVPASKKAKMQALFASMCEEADIVLNKTLERMKIRCDMKQKKFSIHFRRLSKTLQPSC